MTTLILSVFFSISASAYDVDVDGIYYLTPKKNVAIVTKGDKEYSGDITIPSSIKVNDLEYTVKEIKEYTFRGCSGLTSVTIPNSVTSIAEGTFFNCSGLTSVTIPNSVTSIGDKAFYGCSSLTSITIPNSVTRIGNDAFSRCSGLTSVTIPNSVTSIGKRTFCKCYGLTSVTIPNSVTSIGDSAFSGCSGLTSVNIPNSVTSIGEFTFFGCSGLTTVRIPNSVTSIGGWVFSGCSGLTSVTIPNSVTSIGESAFSGCTGLTSVTIPNSVTSIGNSTFYGCRGLTSVTIPNSVTSIGESAFFNCSGLTSVTIPNSVTSIGENAFKDCNIKKLYYDCSVDPYIYSDYLEELIIGDNVTIVYDYFSNHTLRKIVLGKNVAQISSQAFNSSLIEEFTIKGEGEIYCYPNIFDTQDLSKATLYVPESKTRYYQTTEPWSKFGKVLTLNGDTPDEPEKCATPSISYSDGQLQFSCETEGAKCYYTLDCQDKNFGETKVEGNIVTFSACYDITCYAKAEGFANSDVATAKLYWLTSSGSLETNINTAETRGVMASSANGFVTLSGLNTDEQVSFYTADGRDLGSVKAIDGTAHFAAQSGTVVIAKIGKESIKIAVK